jgi:glyoxylase-like metal-dependent hydrolase (beta-lactamase superfamily II)
MTDGTDGVVAVSETQRRLWEQGRLPQVERIAARLWSIPLEIPAGSLPGSFVYAVIEQDGVHLVDAGWESDRNLTLLETALAEVGRGISDIATVVITHHHPDHLGLAPRLRELSGARIVMSARERRVLAEVTRDAARDPRAYAETLREWAVPEARRAELAGSFHRPSATGDVAPDAEVADGDVIALGSRRLEVIATPGHTGGHICLADRDERMLFTGDHVLPRIHSGVGIGILPGDEPLGDLLASLERLAEFDDFLVLPGHEFRFTGLRARRASIAAHHLRRTAEVDALTDELGDAPVWEYARRMTWTAGWEGLDAFSLHSALRQTEMNLELVRSGAARRWLGGR